MRGWKMASPSDRMTGNPHWRTWLHRLERVRIEAIGERIVQEPIGGAEDRGIVRVFEPQALERAEIVHVAQCAHSSSNDLPVARAGAIAMRGSEPLSKVLPNPVVVEKRVVDVEQKDGARR